MAAEMKSSQISEEMAKTSVSELVNQTGFYAKEEKTLKPTFEEAKMGRRWSESTEDQFEDQKKCTIM